jgi:hypothetical protein
MTRTEPASLFAWPEDIGTGYHYEAAHGHDAIVAYLSALYLDNTGSWACSRHLSTPSGRSCRPTICTRSGWTGATPPSP